MSRHLHAVDSTTGPAYTDVDTDPYENDPLSQPHDCTITLSVALMVLALVVTIGFLGWAVL